MSVLPVVLLGTTYFLLVEFGVRESYPGAPVAPLLRIGGGAIALLFVMVAVGCGMLIAEQLKRPIRTILGISERGERDGLEGLDLEIPTDPECRRLLLRVENLIHQKRAGVQARRELEAQQQEAAEILESFRNVGDGRGLPSLSPSVQTSVRPTTSLRLEIERFTKQLRTDLKAMDARIGRLGAMLADDQATEASILSEAEASLDDLESLATVWSLRVERARRDIPEMPGELGSCFRDFSEALGRLRDSIRTGGRVTALMDGARLEIAGLHETIVGLLKDEKGATQ